MSLRSTSLGLLLCVVGCSQTPTRPPAPPKLQALLQPEPITGTKYRSRDELMADPAATPLDSDNQLIQTEAALRKANRDQLDAAALLQAEQSPAKCTGWMKLRRKCDG
jgi:hypothetical protein